MLFRSMAMNSLEIRYIYSYTSIDADIPPAYDFPTTVAVKMFGYYQIRILIEAEQFLFEAYRLFARIPSARKEDISKAYEIVADTINREELESYGFEIVNTRLACKAISYSKDDFKNAIHLANSPDDSDGCLVIIDPLKKQEFEKAINDLGIKPYKVYFKFGKI